MWYYDPDIGLYFLYYGNDLVEKIPPPPSIGSANIRVLLTSDNVKKSEAFYYPNGKTIGYYLVEGSMEEVKTTSKKFPDYPNFQNLTELVKANKLGASAIIAMPDKTVISAHSSTVSIQHPNGVLLLQYLPNSISFHVRPETNGTMFKKYAGKHFTYEGDSVVVRKFIYRIFDGLTFELPSLNLQSTDVSERIHRKIDKLENLIHEYVRGITPSFIAKAFPEVKPGIVVQSRCQGCISHDSSHLIIHMHRKELPFFLLASVFAEYGKVDPIKQATSLIVNCKDNSSFNLVELKKDFTDFLLSKLTPPSVLYIRRPFGPLTYTWVSNKAWQSKASSAEPTIAGGIVFNPSASFYESPSIAMPVPDIEEYLEPE